MSANLSDRAHSVNDALRRNANAGDRTPARSTSPTDFTEARKALPPGIFDPDQDARLFVEPESIDESPERLKELRKTISEVHNATCNGFVSIGLPLKLRPLVSTIIAAADGEKSFRASYATLVGLLFREGDGRTFEAKKSEVRRLLKALVSWQEKTKISLCTVRPGGRTISEKGVEEYHDTEFELVFLDALAKALLRNPAPERMRAAVRMEVAAMMKLPPFDSRWQARRPTLDELRDQARKAALTKAAKAVEATEKLHGDTLAYAEALAAEIVRQAREKYGETSCKDEAEEPPSIESAEVEAQGGVSDPTHPATPQEKPEPKSGAQEVAPLREEYRVLNPAPPVSLLSSGGRRDTGGDAERAVTVFESVGVTEFQVTLKDELAGAALDCETYTGACLRAFLPGLLKRNAERAESIIVRPRKHGPGLIQADDLTGAEIEKVRPLAFFIAETSHQNFQAWFDVTDADETTRRRLLLALNADRGASGAMRLPGSRNMKPLRDGFPIRLVATAPGRQVYVADLERAGLLAPLPCPPPPTVERPRPMTRAPRFPDYARCLADKGDDHNRADAAFVKIAMCEGFTDSEAWAELERVAPREKLQRADYRRRTLSFCSAP
jgi:hypothetical protein